MISFDAKRHAYINNDSRIEYTPVTTFINKFKEPFDVEKFSKLVASREGVSQDEIKKRWNTIKNDACDFGTNAHSLIEEYWSSEGEKNKDNELVVRFLQKSNLKLSNTLNECLVYNHEYKIAGTSDFIVNNKNDFSIVDLKTNKSFRFTSKYNKSMLAPISHLPECEYSVYCLQVSLYAYLYHTMTGKTVGELSMLWLNKETNEFEKYSCPYLYSDIKNMLESYKCQGLSRSNK
jgi:ATP-dependent exoDNAse (exonuclease V) beta subunit